jgi:heme iron utilization protein
MAQVNKTSAERPIAAELATDARGLMRRALKGSLATIDAGDSYPYASLVTLATDASGAPSFLISALARHTRNLFNDPRASILVDGTGGLGDPLQGARVTLVGRAERTENQAVRRRFLARHPEAEFYADFKDFAFWRLAVEGAHYIGGFGRIVDLSPSCLLVATEDSQALVDAEPEIIEHMNADHAAALELYATVLCGAPGGAWRMTGIDAEGCDIMCDGDAQRVPFEARVTSPGDARKEFGRLTAEARARANTT